PDGSYRFANVQVEIDEELMKEIAKETGGKYFRATSSDKLEEIYNEIDQLETSEIEETQYVHYDEKFRIRLLAGLLFMTLEFLMRYAVFRSFVSRLKSMHLSEESICLYALAATPVLLLLYLWVIWWRRRAQSRFATNAMLAELAPALSV